VLEQGFIPAPAWQLQKAKDEQVIRRILNFGNQELTGTRNSGNVIETHGTQAISKSGEFLIAPRPAPDRAV
jgi:hypothetical protein